MNYDTLHIDDAGAIEDYDELTEKGQITFVGKLYDDEDFNTLNDFVDSISNYILNDKALAILQGHNIIPYELKPAIVLRKEKKFCLFKMYKSYHYHWLKLIDPDNSSSNIAECYTWIDFDKSEIFAKKQDEVIQITSHQQTLDLIKENKTKSAGYEFETQKIVFGKNFDTNIDMFTIPMYSWGVYVSERLKNELLKQNITGIGFANKKDDLGVMWRPYFPIIEFCCEK